MASPEPTAMYLARQAAKLSTQRNIIVIKYLILIAEAFKHEANIL